MEWRPGDLGLDGLMPINPIPILNYTAPSGPLKSTPRLNQAFWVATYY